MLRDRNMRIIILFINNKEEKTDIIQILTSSFYSTFHTSYKNNTGTFTSIVFHRFTLCVGKGVSSFSALHFYSLFHLSNNSL